MTWTKINIHGSIFPDGTTLNRTKSARVDQLHYDSTTIAKGRARYNILLAEDHQLGSIRRKQTFWYNAKGTYNTNADNLMTLDIEMGMRNLICYGQYPLNR